MTAGAFSAPKRGERAFVVGGTGSGKTAFAVWLLPYVDVTPFVIYDTKIERKYEALPASRIVETFKDLSKACGDKSIDYVIYRPTVSLLHDVKAMDALLGYHYETFKRSGVMIDELTQFTRSSYPGPGMTSLLTRGRSRGITTVMCTQRPSGIPLFCISESEKYYIFKLKLEEDRERFDGAVPGKEYKSAGAIKRLKFSRLPEPPKHGFWYYDQDLKQPLLYSPVKLAQGVDTGYTDDEAESGTTQGYIWV
jgi:hypothetical protein